MEDSATTNSAVSENSTPQSTLHGFSPRGFIKLFHNGEKYLCVGKLFAVENKAGADGRVATICRLVHETPKDLALLHRIPISLECIGAEDQKRYRFRGQLRSKNRSAPCPSIEAESPGGAKPQFSNPLSAFPATDGLSLLDGKTGAPQALALACIAHDKSQKRNCVPSKTRTRPQDLEAAVAKMKWVTAMTEAGVDVDIKLTTICLLTNESRATVERKLAEGLFPQPRRRGRVRFWSLKEVNSYRAGTWSATPTS